MRMKLIALSDLDKDDTFFNVDPLQDYEGNVYLPQSKFVVLEIDYYTFDSNPPSRCIKSGKFQDEEGREVSFHSLSINNCRVYKSFH